jgi:hypothetical protein
MKQNINNLDQVGAAMNDFVINVVNYSKDTFNQFREGMAIQSKSMQLLSQTLVETRDLLDKAMNPVPNSVLARADPETEEKLRTALKNNIITIPEEMRPKPWSTENKKTELPSSKKPAAKRSAKKISGYDSEATVSDQDTSKNKKAAISKNNKPKAVEVVQEPELKEFQLTDIAKPADHYLLQYITHDASRAEFKAKYPDEKHKGKFKNKKYEYVTGNVLNTKLELNKALDFIRNKWPPPEDHDPIQTDEPQAAEEQTEEQAPSHGDQYDWDEQQQQQQTQEPVTAENFDGGDEFAQQEEPQQESGVSVEDATMATEGEEVEVAPQSQVYDNPDEYRVAADEDDERT